jgi:hypothetical protein
VPLIEFFAPLASRTSKSLPSLSLPHLVCATFRLSQPLSGLLLLDALGLISYLIHFWGFPFRVFPFQRFCSFSTTCYRLSFGLNDYPPRLTFNTLLALTPKKWLLSRFYTLWKSVHHKTSY